MVIKDEEGLLFNFCNLRPCPKLLYLFGLLLVFNRVFTFLLGHNMQMELILL